MAPPLWGARAPTATAATLLCCAFALLQATRANDVFVSPTGNDQTGDGSITKPYLSVGHAIASGKVTDGTTVQLRGGTYFASAGAPLINWTMRSERVTFSSYQAERALLSAGQGIPASSVVPVTNESVLARLPTDAARANVRCVDLRQLGITDYGVVSDSDENMLELFHEGEPMRLARYPNVNASDPRLWQWEHTVSGLNSSFVYSGDRPSANKWAAAPDAWVHVYSYFDWSDDIMAIANLNTANRTITLRGNPQ